MSTEPRSTKGVDFAAGDPSTGSGGRAAESPPARAPGSIRDGLAALLPDLRAFARFLARDGAAADDLVQECLLRALRAEAQWQPGTSLRAWSFSILRNVFYENRRRRAAEKRVLDAVDRGDSMSARQDHRMELLRVGDALAGLPVEQREALVLVGALGFSQEEAADVAGVALGTLKARVSRARKALTARYDAMEQG